MLLKILICLFIFISADCQSGFFKTKIKNEAGQDEEICKPCLEGCAECDNENSCKSCISVYQLKDGKCNTCKSGIVDADTGNGEGDCNKCTDEHTYLDKTEGACKTCPTKCTECSSASFCSSCEEGWAVGSDKLCSECAEGYYKSGETCTKCPDNCLTCESAEVCSTCADGFGLKKQVEKDSSQNDVVKSAQCITCEDSNCKTCEIGDNNEQKCNACVTGRLLSSENKCDGCDSAYKPVDGNCEPCDMGKTYDGTECTFSGNCPTGYYSDGSNCVNCSSKLENCSACSVSKPTNEVTTETMFNILYQTESDGFTCTACTGSYLNNTENGNECIPCNEAEFVSGTTCSSCSEHCKKCNSYAVCDECYEGYYFNKETSACESVCFDDHYFYNIDSDSCQRCQDSCLTCNNENECTECNEGFEMSLDGKTCMKKCYTGYSWNGTACETCGNDACARCNFTESGNPQCYLCVSGNKLNSNFECVESSCKDNQYIADDGSCGDCSKGCAYCITSEKCDICESGYALSNDGRCYKLNCGEGKGTDENGNCASCKENCTQCKFVDTCDECNNEFYVEDGDCKSCTIEGCLVCKIENGIELCDVCKKDTVLSETFTECQTDAPCKTGEYEIKESSSEEQKDEQNQQNVNGRFENDVECGLCPLNCLACNNDTYCFSCDFGYELFDTTDNKKLCARGCDEGYYLNSRGSCTKCSDKNCVVCESDECSECQPGYELRLIIEKNSEGVYANVTKCIETCPVGQAWSGTRCEGTVSNCATTNNNYLECSKCNSGYELSDTLTECKKCGPETNTYVDPENSNKCLNCPTACKKCSNSTVCEECVDGAIKIEKEDGTIRCYLCEKNYYYDADNNGCTPCDSSCGACNDKTQCNYCVGVDFKFEGEESKSLCKCVDTDKYNTGNGYCSQCSDGCLECTSGTECLRCNEEEGYKLMNKVCVKTNKCYANGYGYIDDNDDSSDAEDGTDTDDSAKCSSNIMCYYAVDSTLTIENSDKTDTFENCDCQVSNCIYYEVKPKNEGSEYTVNVPIAVQYIEVSGKVKLIVDSIISEIHVTKGSQVTLEIINSNTLEYLSIDEANVTINVAKQIYEIKSNGGYITFASETEFELKDVELIDTVVEVLNNASLNANKVGTFNMVGGKIIFREAATANFYYTTVRTASVNTDRRIVYMDTEIILSYPFFEEDIIQTSDKIMKFGPNAKIVFEMDDGSFNDFGNNETILFLKGQSTVGNENAKVYKKKTGSSDNTELDKYHVETGLCGNGYTGVTSLSDVKVEQKKDMCPPSYFPEEEGQSLWWISLIVVGFVIFVIIIIAIVGGFIFYRYKKNKADEEEEEE